MSEDKLSVEEKYGYTIITINVPVELLKHIDKKRITPDGTIKRSPFIVAKLRQVFDVNEDNTRRDAGEEG